MTLLKLLHVVISLALYCTLTKNSSNLYGFASSIGGRRISYCFYFNYKSAVSCLVLMSKISGSVKRRKKCYFHIWYILLLQIFFNPFLVCLLPSCDSGEGSCVMTLCLPNKVFLCGYFLL